MDLSNRNTNFITDDKAFLEKIFQKFVEYFGKAWLSHGGGSHRLQILSSRRDPLSTVELLNLADAIDACSGIDIAWLNDLRKKIKFGDLNQQNGALSELMLVGMMRRHMKGTSPAPIDQKGYDAIITHDDGVVFYISIKRFGASSFEKEFMKKANQYTTMANHKLRNRTNSVHSMLVFKKFVTDNDWSAANDVVSRNGFPISFENDFFSSSIFPLHIPSNDSLSPLHYSSWHVITGIEHKNEQNNFLEKVRQAASELERKVSQSAKSRTVLLVHLHSTASLHELHNFAESYLKSDASLDAIILYQPYVVKEPNTTSLIHGLRFAINSNSAGRGDFFNTHPIKFGALIGKQATDGRVWKLLDREGSSVKVKGHYFYQKGDYYVTANEQGNGQAFGNASNPLPGVRQHLVFRGAILQGLFPETDDLEIL